MAIEISEDPSVWRMDFTLDELVEKISEHSLPSQLSEIAVGNRPKALRFWCEPVSPNSIWPLQSDFIPIWTCNGTSAMAYEPSTGHFHYQHIEDIPDEDPDVLKNYLELSVWILGHVIESGESDEEIDEAAKFLEFPHLEQLKLSESDEEFLATIQTESDDDA